MGNKVSDDPRFHYEIWSGPQSAFTGQRASIYYVENHNAQTDYGEVASHFKSVTDVVIDQAIASPFTDEWTGPVSHLVRHTVELAVKFLRHAVSWHSKEDNPKVLFSHNLNKMWPESRDWLLANDRPIRSDSRMAAAEWLIVNLHSIDPSGDLFRFGVSRYEAFGKAKSYDRVGVDLEAIKLDLDITYHFLMFWAHVLYREVIAEDLGWSHDPYFDPNDFPRVRQD